MDYAAIIRELGNVGAFGFGTAFMVVIGLALFRGSSIKELVDTFRGVGKPVPVKAENPEILAKIYKCLEDIPVIKTNHLHELKSLIQTQLQCADRVEKSIGDLNTSLVNHNLQAFAIKNNTETILANEKELENTLGDIGKSLASIKTKLRIQ